MRMSLKNKVDVSARKCGIVIAVQLAVCDLGCRIIISSVSVMDGIYDIINALCAQSL